MKINFIKIVFTFLIISLLSCDNQDTNIENGILYEYYDTGELASQISMLNGKKNGFFIHYYPSGNIKSIHNYSNDTLDGIYFKYFSNQKLKQYGKYIKGKLNGSNINYFRNGKIDFIDQYYNDESYCSGEFDSLGRMSSNDFFIVEMSTPKVMVGDDFVCTIKIFNSREFDKVKFWIADLFPTGAPQKKIEEVEMVNYQFTYREKAKKSGKKIFSGVVLGEKRQKFNINGVIKDTTLNAIFPVYEIYEVEN